MAPALDHTRFEDLLVRLHTAVRQIPHQRDFTMRERELLNRLHFDIGTTLPVLPDRPRTRQMGFVAGVTAANEERVNALLSALTRAEAELVVLLTEGLSNKEIAARLEKSVRTVKTQLTSVYKKLAVRSRSRLLAQLRNGSSRPLPTLELAKTRLQSSDAERAGQTR